MKSALFLAGDPLCKLLCTLADLDGEESLMKDILFQGSSDYEFIQEVVQAKATSRLPGFENKHRSFAMLDFAMQTAENNAIRKFKL